MANDRQIRGEGVHKSTALSRTPSAVPGSSLSAFLHGSRSFTRRTSAIAVPLAVVAIVGLFLLPVPRSVLDLLLGVNLVLSLALLLRALLLRDGRELAAFPVLILLATLFRLALNISSTRLILLYGDQGTFVAGDIIHAFGTFVVGGDFVVGAIVFGVIAVVNFLVITRGAARVAEVSARFALDALPGRQLAIDAEQRQGALSAGQAKLKRDALSQESQFFGAMDGAMRFVQGDAIATLVIVVINAVGGVFLGIQRGLTFSASIANFGVLAIGDGLVSILPALLLSVSSGIVVTNIAGRSVKGKTVGQHVSRVFLEPRALLLAAAVFLFLAFVPRLPTFPFLAVGTILLLVTIRLARATARLRLLTPSLHAEANRFLSSAWPQQVGLILEDSHLWNVDPDLQSGDSFRPIRVSYGSAFGVDDTKSNRSGEFYRALSLAYDALRTDFRDSMGVELPGLSVNADSNIPAAEYRIFVREKLARKGTLPLGRVFVLSAPNLLAGLGIYDALPGQTTVPRVGSWVPDEQNVRDTLTLLGERTYDLSAYLGLEIASALSEQIDEFFGVEETRRRVEELREGSPHVVAEVIDSRVISLPELAQVLRALLRDGVGIRDLQLILEGIASFACRDGLGKERNVWLDELHGSLRQILARSIVSDASAGLDTIRAFVLSPELETEFRDAVSVWDGFPDLPPLDPDIAQAFRTNSQRMFAPVVQRGMTPVVVLCPSDIRAGVHAALRQHDFGSRWFTTVAFEELGVRAKTETVGVVGLG